MAYRNGEAPGLLMAHIRCKQCDREVTMPSDAYSQLTRKYPHHDAKKHLKCTRCGTVGNVHVQFVWHLPSDLLRRE